MSRGPARGPLRAAVSSRIGLPDLPMAEKFVVVPAEFTERYSLLARTAPAADLELESVVTTNTRARVQLVLFPCAPQNRRESFSFCHSTEWLRMPATVSWPLTGPCPAECATSDRLKKRAASSFEGWTACGPHHPSGSMAPSSISPVYRIFPIRNLCPGSYSWLLPGTSTGLAFVCGTLSSFRPSSVRIDFRSREPWSRYSADRSTPRFVSIFFAPRSGLLIGCCASNKDRVPDCAVAQGWPPQARCAGNTGRTCGLDGNERIMDASAAS